MKRRTYLLLLVLIMLPGVIYGQAKVATVGAQFLEIGVSARAVGMGEAFVSIADDASAIYYNPAGLTQIFEKEIMLTHIDYIADINYEFGAIAYPMWSIGGVLGFGFSMLDAGTINETTYEHSMGTGRTFGAKEYAISASYARSLTDHFSVGLTVKLIDELFEEERSTGWAADVGTIYDTGYRGFRISMVISNFGPDMRFIREDYPLPINFKFGGAINVIDNEYHRATLSMEGSHPSDNLEKYSTGIEYTFRDMFSLRVGEKFQLDAGGLSFGAGILLPVKDWNIKVDYAYFDFGVLESVHRFTLGMSF